MEESSLFSISDEPATENFSAPMYEVDIDLINPSNIKDKKPKVVGGKNCCWNCNESGHSIRSCPRPNNPQMINRNRNQFAQNRSEFKRYHCDMKKEKFVHLKAGVVSENLRKALGLRKDQLPAHIYHMRSLGYPPGWLLEAKNDYSGIEMFGFDGNRVPNADEEEGEIGAIKMEYDESKIITFPGFNAYPAPGTLDETEEYGAPPLNYLQSKEYLIESLKSLKVDYYNQPSNWLTISAVGPEQDHCDMETEEIADINLLPVDDSCSFIPPLPDEPNLPPPPPPQRDLEDGEEVNDEKSEDLSSEKDIPLPPAEVAACEERPVSSVEETGNISGLIEEDKFEDADKDTLRASLGQTKSVELGTPVLKIHSPYNKLPPPQAFKKDVSDVIFFENLPNSTGAYEKIKGVLKSVSTRLMALRGTKLNINS